MRSLEAIGSEVTVVAPTSYTSILKAHSHLQMPDFHEFRDGVSVYRPRFISFSNFRLPWGGTTWRWMVHRFIRAAQRTVSNLSIIPDVCYAHFLYPAGIAAVDVAIKLGVPCVLSLGESRYSLYEDNYGVEEVCRLVSKFDGIVAVNSQIKNRCVSRYGVLAERVVVLPNGVDTSKFYPRNRLPMRNKLGLPEDKVIIAMIGQFAENKGPIRVLKAIRPLTNIGAIFLGDGPQKPLGEQVLFAGKVSNDEIPDWLSAVDMFVLPTLSEGCSNAILEALACGLPVISSDRSFNHDVLDESVSILTDPMDVGAIRKAILTLMNNPEQRLRMSEAARQRALKFSITERARGILDWLTLTICEDHSTCLGAIKNE